MPKGKKFSSFIFIMLLLLTSMIINACATTNTPTESAPAEPITLKLALLPVLDTLPIYVADQEGLFSKHGVQIEFIPIASAPERDQVIAAGQADGMVNEAVSTMFFNKEATRVQIVRYARAATTDQAVFRILVAANSDINNVDDLKGVGIGISQGTVIEYLTDRLLEAEGFSADEIQGIAVPKIPDRMALLGTGELAAAMLPEPLSSLAELQGARVILDDTRHPEYSFSTISFRKAVIDEHPQAIRGFLAALEEAVTMINSDPAKWNSLLSEKQLVPEPLLDTYQVPTFGTAGIPTEEQWNDALAWAKGKGLLNQDVSYPDSVTDIYLP
jgi:NitT/TauT family transport system substrate-binding protein